MNTLTHTACLVARLRFGQSMNSALNLDSYPPYWCKIFNSGEEMRMRLCVQKISGFTHFVILFYLSFTIIVSVFYLLVDLICGAQE